MSRRTIFASSPNLCDRTRYGRRLRRLTSGIEMIRQHLVYLSGSGLSRLRVADNFQISLCHLRQVPGSTQPFEYFAAVGYCASKKEFFYGLRMRVMTDARGMVVGYLLTYGHVHDTKGLSLLLMVLCESNRCWSERSHYYCSLGPPLIIVIVTVIALSGVSLNGTGLGT